MRRVHTKLADESPAFIPRTSTGNWQGHIGGIIEGGRLRPPFLNSLLTSVGAISFVEFNLVMITSYSCKLNFFLKKRCRPETHYQEAILIVRFCCHVGMPFFPLNCQQLRQLINQSLRWPWRHTPMWATALLSAQGISPPDTATQIAVISC